MVPPALEGSAQSLLEDIENVRVGAAGDQDPRRTRVARWEAVPTQYSGPVQASEGKAVQSALENLKEGAPKLGSCLPRSKAHTLVLITNQFCH